MPTNQVKHWPQPSHVNCSYLLSHPAARSISSYHSSLTNSVFHVLLDLPWLLLPCGFHRKNLLIIPLTEFSQYVSYPASVTKWNFDSFRHLLIHFGWFSIVILSYHLSTSILHNKVFHNTTSRSMKQINMFKYLGTLIKADGRCIQGVKSRLAQEKAAFHKLKNARGKIVIHSGGGKGS